MSSAARFGLAVTLSIALFITLMGRLFYLQIVHGESFRERARISFVGHERIPARRGLIKDAAGRVLASNQASHQLTVTPFYLGKEREAVVTRLAQLLSLNQQEVDELNARIDEGLVKDRWAPIVVRRELVSEACPFDGASLELLESPARRLTCGRCGLRYEPIDPKAVFCPIDRGRLTWHGVDDGQHGDDHVHASCNKCGRGFVTAPVCPNDGQLLTVDEQNLGCPVCKRTFSDEVASLQAQLYTLPGVELHTSFRREYPFRYDGAHVIGYMNRVTREDREREPGVYELTDMRGRRGVEDAAEAFLRGAPGEALFLKGARGKRLEESELKKLIQDVEFRRSIPGDEVWLTLDMQLQREVKRAFRYYKSGAAVVVDAKTGGVLAMYSKPGFDPNIWSGRLTKDVWEETQANPYSPLLNKALTTYAPGSTYKIVTSIAGLEEGIITPDMTIHCPGHYEYGGRRFHCHNRSGHGPVNMIQALKYSCDVYFYRVGEMLGMDTLARYGHAFGFGEPTGVEISEREGRVPTRAWHTKNSPNGYQPGFVLSTAIGQGDLMASSLQVARAFAALANGGRVLKMHLVKRRVDEHGHTVYEAPVEVVKTIDAAPQHMALVREGLVRVVNDPDGTASDSALDSVVIAGKTGTAESAESRPGVSPEIARWLKEDHAWFAAYAPAEDPQIVVVVFVEHGGSGSKTAAPIAQRIIRSWLRLAPRPPSAALDPEPPDHGGDEDALGDGEDEAP